MSLKKSTAQKLASLSAIGAGALILGSGEAIANPVGIGPVPVGVSVGFGAGGQSFATVTLQGTSKGFSFERSSSFEGYLKKVSFSGKNGLKFRTFKAKDSIYMLQLVSSGKTFFGAGSNSYRSGTVARRFFKSNRTSVVKTARNTGTSRYTFADFKFKNGTSNTLFGWVKLDLTNKSRSVNSKGEGPFVTIESYAYATDGSELPAGEIPTSGVPEPGTFGTAAMGALALGAVGLRRWRAARKAA